MGDVVQLRPGAAMSARPTSPRPRRAFAIGARVRDRRCDRAGEVTGTGWLQGADTPATYTVRWDGALVAETIAAVNVAAEAPGIPGPVLATLPGARTLSRDQHGRAAWTRGDDSNPTPPSAA